MSDSQLKISVISGIIWKLSERLLARGVEFFISLVLARLLLPNDYGLVALVLVFISLADVFVTSSFATSLIQKKDANRLDFSTMFYCSLMMSIVVYLILFFCAPIIANFYNQPILVNIIRVFSLRLPLGVYNSMQHAYVARHMLFKRFFWSTLFGTIFSGVVGIAMALYGFGVWALIAQYFTNTLVDTLVLAITVPWYPRAEFSLNAARPLIRFGWKVLLADLSGTFFDQLRSLIIGRVYLPRDLAFYNRGQQFPNFFTTNITTAAISVLFPAISNVNDDIDRVKQMTRRTTQLLAFIVFPMLAGLAIVSKPLILVVLTEKWSSSIIFLQLFCISAAGSVLGNVSSQSIKAIGRSDVLLKLEFVKKPIYLMLLLIGVRFGVFAIAVTMVIYSFYGVFINTLQLRKYINYLYHEQFEDIVSAGLLSLGMGFIVYVIGFLKMSNLVLLLVQISVGIISYVLLSVITKNASYYYLKSLLLDRR